MNHQHQDQYGARRTVAILAFPSSRPPFTVAEAAEWFCEYREARDGQATGPCKLISGSSNSYIYPTYPKEELTPERWKNDIYVAFSFNETTGDAGGNPWWWSHVSNMQITNGVYDGDHVHRAPGAVHSYDGIEIPVPATPALPFPPLPPPLFGLRRVEIVPNRFFTHSPENLALIGGSVLLGELWFGLRALRQRRQRREQKQKQKQGKDNNKNKDKELQSAEGSAVAAASEEIISQEGSQLSEEREVATDTSSHSAGNKTSSWFSGSNYGAARWVAGRLTRWFIFK